jgi:hypothetical protein
MLEGLLNWLLSFISNADTQAVAIVIVAWLVGHVLADLSIYKRLQGVYWRVEQTVFGSQLLMTGAEKCVLGIQTLKGGTSWWKKLIYAVFGQWNTANFKRVFDELAGKENTESGRTVGAGQPVA